MAGARIWVVNQVDFSDNRNLIVAAVTLVLGAGDFTVKLGNFTLGGIAPRHVRRHHPVRLAASQEIRPAGPGVETPARSGLPGSGRDRRVARAPWARTAAGSASIT